MTDPLLTPGPEAGPQIDFLTGPVVCFEGIEDPTRVHVQAPVLDEHDPAHALSVNVWIDAAADTNVVPKQVSGPEGDR